MGEKKEDRRVKYTKRVLKDSLLKLMREKPIQKISVTEICRTADINRNTFYAHYYSPENLLTQIENDLFQQIMEPIHRSAETKSLLPEICQLIYANKELSTILLSEHGNKDFLERIKEIGYESFMREWQASPHRDHVEMLEKIYTFVTNGTVGIIQDWVQNDMKERPEVIAAVITHIIGLLQTAVLQE